jgi:hypothetical protein
VRWWPGGPLSRTEPLFITSDIYYLAEPIDAQDGDVRVVVV